jgi:hypothetical protein
VNQFFIPNLASKQRCDASLNNGVPDTFSGIDAIHGHVGMYTGVVQSPDQMPHRAQMARDLAPRAMKRR